MKYRFQPAFTLIELIVAITIISILASISIIGATSIQRSTRDDARKSQSSIVAEALEKYYENSNEYPSVASITNQPMSTVKQKLAIKNDQVLTFPTVTAGTSALVASNPTPARLTYVARTTDTNANEQCQQDPSGYCDAFVLQYVKESDNSTVTINSRHNAVFAIGNPPGPVVLSSPTQPAVIGSLVSSSLVRFTASSATCSVGSVEYKVRYNTTSSSTSSMPDWSTVSWGAGTTKDINPGANTRFYSQSLARCVSGTDSSADSSPSAVDSLDFTPAPPAGTPPGAITVSASSSSSTSLVVSWNNVSGSSPITYYVSYTPQSGSNVAAPGCSNTTSISCNINGLAASTTYTIYVNAVNDVGSSQGYTVATTQAAPPVGTAPSAPIVNASPVSPTSLQVSWTASSGTSPITYTVRYGTIVASGCSGIAGTSCTITGLSPSTLYNVQVTATNSYGTATGSSSATTSAPALIAGASTPGRWGGTDITWDYNPSGYVPPTSVKFNVGICGTNLSSTTRSCHYDKDPCRLVSSITVSDTAGATTTVSVPAGNPGKPGINVNGSTVNGDNSITVNWNWTGDITWVQMRRKKTAPDGTVTNTYVDYIDQGGSTSNPSGSGSYRTGALGSGTFEFTVAAANCKYRADWSFSNSNYLNAATDSTTPKVIP